MLKANKFGIRKSTEKCIRVSGWGQATPDYVLNGKWILAVDDESDVLDVMAEISSSFKRKKGADMADIKRKLCVKLFQSRNSADMTQAELGEKADLSIDSISRMYGSTFRRWVGPFLIGGGTRNRRPESTGMTVRNHWNRQLKE